MALIINREAKNKTKHGRLQKDKEEQSSRFEVLETIYVLPLQVAIVLMNNLQLFSDFLYHFAYDSNSRKRASTWPNLCHLLNLAQGRAGPPQLAGP